MESKDHYVTIAVRIIVSLFVLFLLWNAGLEYFTFSWGSGNWLGAFTLKRGIGFITLILIWLLILLVIGMGLWHWERTNRLEQKIIRLREHMGWLRWLLVGVVLVTPVWLLQFSYFGSVIDWSYMRLTLFLVAGGVVGVLVTRGSKSLITTSNLIAGLLLIATAFNLGQSFRLVTDYPFSLSWSEGNRMWDYSALFGHRLYDYPADQSIYAYIDRGRQALWGFPFLFFDISITQMRIWNSLVWTVPYALLGWIVFKKFENITSLWLLSGLWTYTFLNQGPIYTPLVISAILVAIAWRHPRWYTLPLIAVAGYYTDISRFTWIFAPAIWAGMLFLGDLTSGDHKFRNWKLAISGVFMGLLGGYMIPRWQNFSRMISFSTQQDTPVVTPSAQADIISLEGIQTVVSRQPLLWERLLPNPTYRPGIVIALLLAIVPLIILLNYLIWTRRWKINWFQGVVIFVSLSLFLVVGIIVSVKIGGGSNLHNLDMFLIGLVFTAALAWKAGGYKVLLHLDNEPIWVQLLLALMMILYALPPLMSARPLSLPSNNVVEEALTTLQRQVKRRKDSGEILFIDQRQLLTFGYIQDVPLVTDYEKKYLMDQAMSGNEAYFKNFYNDLANRRFSLIVTETLFINYQDQEYGFANENNAWVKWVAEPVLCYYVPKMSIKGAKVQVLIPRGDPTDCPQ